MATRNSSEVEQRRLRVGSKRTQTRPSSWAINPAMGSSRPRTQTPDSPMSGNYCGRASCSVSRSRVARARVRNRIQKPSVQRLSHGADTAHHALEPRPRRQCEA
jgi:hypothetical protein